MARAIRVSVITWLVLLAAPSLCLASGGGESPLQAEWYQAVFTIVVFAILLVVLGKFAWSPILAALKQREDFIRESLDAAKRDREAAEARLKEYEQKLHDARKEASAVVEEGRRDAEVLKRKLESDARKEATATIERAKREIEAATDTAIKGLYDLSAKLATDVAARIIRKELSPEDHRQLISESIEQLGKIERN